MCCSPCVFGAIFHADVCLMQMQCLYACMNTVNEADMEGRPRGGSGVLLSLWHVFFECVFLHKQDYGLGLVMPHGFVVDVMGIDFVMQRDFVAARWHGFVTASVQLWMKTVSIMPDVPTGMLLLCLGSLCHCNAVLCSCITCSETDCYCLCSSCVTDLE